MRRTAVISLAVLAAFWGGVADAQVSKKPPKLAAHLASCQTGLTVADRHAVFTGSMARMSHTRRMAMRFDLLERRPGQTQFKRLDIPHWSVWQRSRPQVAGFLYTKRVDGLAAPGTYRAVVRFRWYGPDGHRQRQTLRVTGVCRQPDLRPDLTVGRLTAAPAPDGQAAYTVVVHNAGRSDAGAFGLDLAVAEQGLAAPVGQAALPAGASREAVVTAARCAPGSSVVVALDPDHRVAESDESNDVARRRCPFTSR